uniref:BTB domain-containing protein n=1 Tax=Panagrellus redivivus TaxID=6233 RepID=A0A7E4VEQ8_PANRE
MGTVKEEWVSFDESLPKMHRGSDDPLQEGELNDIPLDEEKKPAPISLPPPVVPPRPSRSPVMDDVPAEIVISKHEEHSKHSSRRSSVDSGGLQPKPAALDNVNRNGKIAATIFPTNSHLAWVAPPVYDRDTLPQALADVGLPAEVYTAIVRRITDDTRFRCYAMGFSRILPTWVVFSIFFLLLMLVSSPDGGFAVMVMTLCWMVMLFVGVFFCIVIRKHLRIGLTECIGEANKDLLHHSLIVGVQDRGQLSCHKVVLIFMKYDVSECLVDIEKLLRVSNASTKPKPIIMTHDEMTNAVDCLLRGYIQPYIKGHVKRRFLFPTRPSEGVSDFRPKHCQKQHCLCQYIEAEHFNTIKETWYERLI